MPKLISFAPIKSWFANYKASLIRVGIGQSLYQGFNFAFDNITYPLMIGFFGWKGAVIMSVGSFIQCALTLIFYQWWGIDWVGVGLVENLKKEGYITIERFLKTGSWFYRIIFGIPAGFMWVILWMINKSDFLAFIALGIWQDPFIISAYFKKADFKNKLTKRDWKIFLAGWAWSNLYWIFCSGIIAYSAIWLWHLVF